MKQVTFKHKTGSRKHIPGVAAADCEPRMKVVSEYAAQIGKHIDVFRPDTSHVVRVNLADVNPKSVRLTELEKEYPQVVQDRILQRRADELENLVRYNEEFLARLKVLEDKGEIGDVEIVDAADVPGPVVATLDLAEIAWADMIDRGIPIPELVRRANAEKIAQWESARGHGDVPPPVRVSPAPPAGTVASSEGGEVPPSGGDPEPNAPADPPAPKDKGAKGKGKGE